MDLKEIVRLNIAKNKIDFAVDINKELDYSKWVEYVTQHLDYFTWDEGRLYEKVCI